MNNEEMSGTMTLGHALRILCDTHTRDDPRIGYQIIAGAHWEICSHFSMAEYNQAWEVARRCAGFRTEPESHNAAPTQQETANLAENHNETDN